MLNRYTLLLTFIITVAALKLSAQETDPNNGLKHWMTPEEAAQADRIGAGFQETDPPPGAIRNIEEFGPSEGVLIRYPFGIPMSLIKEMAKDAKVTTIVANSSQQSTVTSQYQAAGVNLANCNFLLSASNSYWTRDYGPWYVNYSDSLFGIIDFPYNRPRPDDDEIPKKVAAMQGIPWFGMNVIHTGGNYMTDGLHQASSTTLVWDENLSQTHNQIAQKLHDYCGIDNYMVVEDPNNTYIDHIDCWGKFIGPDKILIRQVPPSHPQYDEIEAVAAFYASQPSTYGTPYRVYRVNTPNNEPYTNSYILNNKVFIPYMGTLNDGAAAVAYQQAMPGYKVTGYLALANAAWESTDALHCRTHEMADRGMLLIEHTPITGVQPFQLSYAIHADISALSRQAIYADSVLLIYKINGGSYNTLSMVNTAGKHWVGYIPVQMEGSTVAYYIHAADASGRNANHPFIGAPDPHVFQVAVSAFPDVVVTPDSLVFETVQEIITGKKAWAANYSQQPVIINYINHPEPHPIPWFIDPWLISIPYTVGSGDSLELNVKLEIPAARQSYWVDTLVVETGVSTHKVKIVVNSDLYNHSGTLYKTEGLVTVNPNPASEKFMFNFYNPGIGNVKLEIYDPFGRLIAVPLDRSYVSGNHSAVWIPDTQLKSGIYFYRMRFANNWVSGKLIVER